ncbi:signal peptidase I [Dactylosporangium sp. CS-033363]|uniref:signal peptidase I n=1 Tax=Dactylosporangium sp. CS-033363 TaxID=3239935 RepID=UPI003D8A0A48
MIPSLVLTAGALIVLAAFLRRRYLVVTVYGRSMLPSYRGGDRLLVRRTGLDKLRPGSVVVFRSPDAPTLAEVAAFSDDPVTGVLPDERLLIKRLAAVPGDPAPVDRVPALAALGSPVVPPGMVVVLGDNPAVSHDSRAYGYLPATHVIGVALRRLSVVQA